MYKSYQLTIPPKGPDLESRIARFRARALQRALDRSRGNRTAAARALGMTLKQVNYAIEKLGGEL